MTGFENFTKVHRRCPWGCRGDPIGAWQRRGCSPSAAARLGHFHQLENEGSSRQRNRATHLDTALHSHKFVVSWNTGILVHTSDAPRLRVCLHIQAPSWYTPCAFVTNHIQESNPPTLYFKVHWSYSDGGCLSVLDTWLVDWSFTEIFRVVRVWKDFVEEGPEIICFISNFRPGAWNYLFH